MEIFILIAPLLTYPYLVRVLGRELYGWVITAQVTASYCSVFIDFGFKRISARHIAANSGNLTKMAEVISAILTLRGILWILSFIIYFTVVWIIEPYRHQLPLFLFSFLTTLSSVLFLDFYFQGTENMKYITIINIIVRSLFVAATFFVISRPSDYIYVPLLWSVGYIIGGALSIWVAFGRHKLTFSRPSCSVLKSHMREGSIIFFSDAMLSIKDKFNYNLMGAMIGMSDIVVYDVGSKISNLLQKPVTILSTALFPKMAKTPSITIANKILLLITMSITVIVAIVNIFIPWIVKFFIAEDIDLIAIRLFTLVPIILGISSFIAVNIFYAFGKDKWILNSTIVTTISYLVLLALMYFTDNLKSVLSFVFLTITSLLIEAVYRGIMCRKLFLNNQNKI